MYDELRNSSTRYAQVLGLRSGNRKVGREMPKVQRGPKDSGRRRRSSNARAEADEKQKRSGEKSKTNAEPNGPASEEEKSAAWVRKNYKVNGFVERLEAMGIKPYPLGRGFWCQFCEQKFQDISIQIALRHYNDKHRRLPS